MLTRTTTPPSFSFEPLEGRSYQSANLNGLDLRIIGETSHPGIWVSQTPDQVTVTVDGQKDAFNLSSVQQIHITDKSGSDYVVVDRSVWLPATVTVVNAQMDKIWALNSNTVTWCDVQDYYWGSPPAIRVNGYVGGVSKNWGDHLMAPVDSPADLDLSRQPLFNNWGDGSYTDVAQGQNGDCYFLAALESIAYGAPHKFRSLITDLGDGTYAVAFHRYGVDSFVRVDGRVSSLYSARTPNGDSWVPLLEKAYAWFRSGQNTYLSLDLGNPAPVFADLGFNTTVATPSLTSGNALVNAIQSSLAAGHLLVGGTGFNTGGTPIISSHDYTVTWAGFANGQGWVQVRNPWGTRYDNQGAEVIPIAQFQQTFVLLDTTL